MLNSLIILYLCACYNIECSDSKKLNIKKKFTKKLLRIRNFFRKKQREANPNYSEENESQQFDTYTETEGIEDNISSLPNVQNQIEKTLVTQFSVDKHVTMSNHLEDKNIVEEKFDTTTESNSSKNNQNENGRVLNFTTKNVSEIQENQTDSAETNKILISSSNSVSSQNESHRNVTVEVQSESKLSNNSGDDKYTKENSSSEVPQNDLLFTNIDDDKERVFHGNEKINIDKKSVFSQDNILESLKKKYKQVMCFILILLIFFTFGQGWFN
ncbi:hypothetical protein EDEG_01770 [Edhazardia aedis USNM 41457]|uniref:Uncharacterized protein n=1 Tax=Edhazardia aedis (strain USNM 41457) TaxID=1003232 RepID=J9D8W3_EDHAE|nr:hypothetical protein EDEG_01770 [Edhazardia aedis USNM 41457]|eukprot:EJW03944.1 hypothetical protein EDEG_01770 [Edhazardia aedis USNM 41457]